MNAAPLTVDTLPYPVMIGRDLEKAVASFTGARGYSSIFVVCDARVQAHAERYAAACKTATPVLAFPLGERRKRLTTVEKVLDALADAGADRGSLLIGVGGGVAGDLFGYVAASYMRGIAFCNIATSVVAMVDAAIGGKTGVDLRAGKNLAGVFRDPVAVFAAVETLDTLPLAQLREGLGEVVKHAILEGADAFERLEELAPHALRSWPWPEIIAESMRIKAMFVNDDRLEAGSRALLNLGHTFAHGFEYATNYRLSHGAAVALGLRAAGLLALRRGQFSADEHLRVLSLLALLKLPLCEPDLDIDAVWQGMAADKKAQRGQLQFVLPRAIGDVEYGVAVPAASVRAVLGRLAAEPGPKELR